jgi:hypothetical protein|tara:strand:- start:915 stop:1127 length:213 start_codon:yes stop_codon:yes gene_type:complete
MAVLGLYDTTVMGYRVKIMPYVIGIFDDELMIEGDRIPNKIVKYLIDEGFCDTWLERDTGIRVNIYRQKC